MITAYEGNLPYIFVSYAHKDSREVFDLIEKLSARGYRIWYDEGIEPGSEWPENIANHLLGAYMVLAVITNDSMASVNCRREINFALAKSKPFLSVVMEKTIIPPGMELQLSNQQSVLRYNYTDEERFLNKIETCSYMAVCRDDTVPKKSVKPNASAAAHKASDRKKPDIRIIAAIGIILAALAVFYAIPKKNAGSDMNADDQSAMISTDGSDTSETDSEAETDRDELSGTVIESDSYAESKTESDRMSDSQRWLYSVSETDESLIYTFRSGPVIVMPISWNHNITVMEEDNYFVFYHTDSRNSWKNDGYEHKGFLFSLGYSTTQDYKVFPSYSELGRADDGYYFLMYPTDEQGYVKNERIFNEYNEMKHEVDYVKKNSSFSME